MGKNHLKAAGLLVGMIFGAGIFALPFVISKSGIVWGLLHFFLALGLMVFLHLWYGEIIYFTPEKMRFAGYAGKLLGRPAKAAAFSITLFLYYGALLVYGILGGVFLSAIFPLPAFALSIMIFILGGFFVFLNLRKIADINFYLTAVLAGAVLYLFVVSLPGVKAANFFSGSFNLLFNSGWFFPYGVWLFALSGFASLPEAAEIISGSSLKNFKKIILVGLLVCTALYLLFIFAVLGASGANVSLDSLSGLAAVLGQRAVLAGSVLGFLAIFTSFIVMAADLKNIFRYDFRFPKWLAWLGVVFLPLVLFLLGATDLISVLEITGAIGLGLTGVLIILMARRLPEKRKNKKFLFFSGLAVILLLAGVLISIFSQINL